MRRDGAANLVLATSSNLSGLLSHSGQMTTCRRWLEDGGNSAELALAGEGTLLSEHRDSVRKKAEHWVPSSYSLSLAVESWTELCGTETQLIQDAWTGPQLCPGAVSGASSRTAAWTGARRPLVSGDRPAVPPRRPPKAPASRGSRPARVPGGGGDRRRDPVGVSPRNSRPSAASRPWK